MAEIRDIPELQALVNAADRIRIPQEIDVPITPRVKSLIDSRAFRHLHRISQLGLVQLVYPGATHTRFEHSLGVYRNALIMLNRLSIDSNFCNIVTISEAETFVVASLLHDLGHWPFCHAIEDLNLASVSQHEARADQLIAQSEIADVLRNKWNLDPAQVVDLICNRATTPGGRILQSCLSGPVDVDKLDYLYRDSLHAGVPYGLNVDNRRLVASFCLNENADGLAITEKGKTAAELLVFARYIMFSEVYWHHAVRSATAMLQRGFYELNLIDATHQLFELSETDWMQQVQERSQSQPWNGLFVGLFGSHRTLYKRLAQYSSFEVNNLYVKLARRPYDWLVQCSNRVAELISKSTGRAIEPHQILIDAPPVGLEVQFDVDVFYPKEQCFRPFGQVSPMIKTLATQQFDDMVKRVRVFCDPKLYLAVDPIELAGIIDEAAELSS